MAYVTTQNLCAGMVVARNLLDRNQRILLRAGVALSESHIKALRSLGIAGLEIRGSHTPLTGPTPSANPPSSATAAPRDPLHNAKPAAQGNRAKIENTLQTLQVTRAASKPLRPKLEPVMARQSEVLLDHLLEGTPIKRNSAVAAVIQMYTLRLLRMKSVKKQTPVY